MDSPQTVVSPLKNSSLLADPEKQNGTVFVENSNIRSRQIHSQEKGTTNDHSEDSLGAALEVYIHQARDIHNICIYQNQDVYAKFCLTSHPEDTVSTKIINGGGRNPIFNENLRLNVHKVESSLKCEIWMLSRVKNYLQDQLLGVALVPVSEVLINDSKLEKEFSLSSTDLFHSPAGFVQLSVSYVGVQPDVIALPAPPTCVEDESVVQDMECNKSLSNDFDNIEFPDPKVANENHQMVEEYISLPCSNLESQCSDSFVSSDTENQVTSEMKVPNGEKVNITSENMDSPLSSVSANGVSPASPPVSSQSCDTPKDSKLLNEEELSIPKDDTKQKAVNALGGESNATVDLSSNEFVKPLVSVNTEPESSKVVQQDIVDMYMKSMQQFTESLAKMKLPMDFESGPTSSSNSSTDPKSPSSKNSGSRVFYGSRAFF